MIASIAGKELRVLARSPLTWLAFALLQLVFAWLFLAALESWLIGQDERALKPGSSGATAWLVIRLFAPATSVLMAITPLLTMRLLAEERAGTGMELLLSSPVSPWRVVAGKYTAALGFYSLMLVPLVLGFVALLPFVDLDVPLIVCALLGVFLLGSLTCAIGLFCSGLTRQTPVAALAGFSLIFLLWVMGNAVSGSGEGVNALVLASPAHQVAGFLRGLLSLSSVAYFVVFALLFLVLTVRQIDNLRSQSPDSVRSVTGSIGFASAAFTLAVLIFLVFERHPVRVDTTAQHRHSLADASVAAVIALEDALTVEAWVTPDRRTRQAIEDMVERYLMHKTDIQLEIVNPELAPARARALSISAGGELILRYQDREQRISALDEASMTHAILRLMHTHTPSVRFVTGHLERHPDLPGRNAYSQFATHLRALGFSVQPISLVTEPVVPDDTGLLVIAAPGGDYFPGESASVLNYLAAGGNLLWLIEPGQSPIPVELAAELGMAVAPGVVVDVASQQLAVDTPDFAVIGEYPQHNALPANLPLTLFPQAAGLTFPATLGWQVEPLLQTGPSSWTETGPLAGTVAHNPELGERAGPIVIGAALNRSRGDSEQRIVVLGDADFLADGWLGNGGNKYLGQSLVNWLAGQQRLPDIAPLQAADSRILLSKSHIAVIGGVLLLALPLLFAVAGFVVWRAGRS